MYFQTVTQHETMQQQLSRCKINKLLPVHISYHNACGMYGRHFKVSHVRFYFGGKHYYIVWYRKKWNYHFRGVATWICKRISLGTRYNENWNVCSSYLVSCVSCDFKLRLKFMLQKEYSFSDLNKLSHFTYRYSFECVWHFYF